MANFPAPPPFLADGTFQWSRRGYFYASPPSQDLHSPKALASPDPWIALAARLESAKAAEFKRLRDLPDRASGDVSRLYAHACMSLFGDAGSDLDLDSLRPRLASDSSEACFDGCWAAYCAGLLRLLPDMLESVGRVRSPGDRDSVCYWICDLLEPTEEGPLRSDVGLDLGEWVHEARSTFETVQGNLGAEKVVWRGRPFRVEMLAAEMQEIVSRIDEESGAAGLLITLRHRFEAATGIDCTSFFKDGRVRPLEVAAILEDFQEKKAASFGDPGRYFFGHQVP